MDKTGCHISGCGCGGAQGHDHGPRPPVSEPVRPWRPVQGIRAISIGIFTRGDQILATPVHDDAGQIKGWRPLGGGIEPGEPSQEALIREMHEETGQDIRDLTLLGVLENIYTHEGTAGHEVVFVYGARFCEPQIYQADQLAVQEGPEHTEAKWISLPKARAGRLQLYPDGLADLLSDA